MFEKYSSQDYIVIESDDVDDDYETLTWLMPSYIDSEIDSFRDTHASSIQRAMN